jgi:hypothetical protein
MISVGTAAAAAWLRVIIGFCEGLDHATLLYLSRGSFRIPAPLYLSLRPNPHARSLAHVSRISLPPRPHHARRH